METFIVRGNIVRVCASEDAEVNKCVKCQRVGDLLMGDFNYWDCGKAEGSMIYLGNNGKDKKDKPIHYIIGCELYVSGYKALAVSPSLQLKNASLELLEASASWDKNKYPASALLDGKCEPKQTVKGSCYISSKNLKTKTPVVKLGLEKMQVETVSILMRSMENKNFDVDNNKAYGRYYHPDVTCYQVIRFLIR